MERGFLNVWWCRTHNVAKTGGPFECPICKAEERAAEKLSRLPGSDTAAPPGNASGSPADAADNVSGSSEPDRSI